MTDEITHFSTQFPQVAEQDWRELTEKFIKGADFDETLVRYTEDGLVKGPLFSRKDIETPDPMMNSVQPHLDGRPWHIGALVDYPGINTANIDLLEELKGGASTITLDLGTETRPGVQLRSKTDVERLFSGIHTNLTPINIMPSVDNFDAAALLAVHFQSDPKLHEAHVSLGYAPEYGNDQVVDLAKWVLGMAPHWKALSVDARRAHEAGGSPAQELALMLSQGCSFMRALLSADIDVNDAIRLMDIYLACDQDGHQNIVKLRAARLLWARMVESFGASDTARNCTLHVVSSERMLAAQDPWSNMIRLSAASFGAICGGADTVTLLPFTHALGLATPFAKRISRNIQLMMMEESHLGHVHDPAHGSFMHEKLSHDLAEKAWGIFQHMQSIAEPLDWLKKEIANTAEIRSKKIENNEIQLVGVNQYAKPDVRKAEIRNTPKIKPRTGELVSASQFKDAIKQVENGFLLPHRNSSTGFPKIRLSETFDNAGDT